MSLPPVRVSVVVPTRNRRAALERLLESLESQTLARAELEVIVVDDASEDDTPSMLERCRARAEGPFVSVRLPERSGPATARNAGWRRARGTVIAFTDDDCVADPRWLEAGLGCFANGVGVVLGHTRSEDPHPACGHPLPGRERGSHTGALHFSRTMEVHDESWHYPTCNVFYARAALASVGGFDERFRHACAEDTDLAWRVKKRGQGSRFCAGAVVVHEVRPPDFLLFLKERRRFADQVLLVKRHPELRRFYYRRYFYRRSHLHVVAAIVVAGLAVHSPAAMLLLPGIWLDRLRRSDLGRDWRSRFRAASQLLVADYWEFSVFCYANLRYRSILL